MNDPRASLDQILGLLETFGRLYARQQRIDVGALTRGDVVRLRRKAELELWGRPIEETTRKRRRGNVGED